MNTAPPLQPFVELIGWEGGGQPIVVLGEYADALALRLVRLTGDPASASGPAAMAVALDLLDVRCAGGVVSGLTWPPVAAMLLGRWPRPPTLTELERLLIDQPARPVLAPGNAVVPESDWSHGVGPGTSLGENRWLGAVKRVDRAWELVDRLGGPVSGLVRTCTRLILLRGSEAGEVGSWSTDELIGCTVLLNADVDDFTVATLAEAIVHETIHHVQAMFEVGRPFVTDPSLAASPARYDSPWSGQPLTAKSLVAACFVWYSLARMWDRVDGAADAGTKADHLWRASRGFVAGDPAGQVAGLAWALDREIPAVISTLQDAVRTRWAQGVR